jgi:hypothetical protein
MMETNKHFLASFPYHLDWYFLYSMLNGTARIVIGLAIASMFG